MERIILDTDIGTDVDDVMAVALADLARIKGRGYYHSLWRCRSARQNGDKGIAHARPGGYSRNGRLSGCIAAQPGNLVVGP